MVAIDAVVASSNEGGVQGGSLPKWHKYVMSKADENILFELILVFSNILYLHTVLNLHTFMLLCFSKICFHQ